MPPLATYEGVSGPRWAYLIQYNGQLPSPYSTLRHGTADCGAGATRSMSTAISTGGIICSVHDGTRATDRGRADQTMGAPCRVSCAVWGCGRAGNWITPNLLLLSLARGQGPRRVAAIPTHPCRVTRPDASTRDSAGHAPRHSAQRTRDRDRREPSRPSRASSQRPRDGTPPGPARIQP